MTDLDAFQKRLRALADGVPPASLSPSARARAEQAAEAQHRAQQRRRSLWSAALVTSAAALGAVAWLGGEARDATRRASTTPDVAPQHVPAIAPASAPCTAQHSWRPDDARRVLDLGSRALLVASRDSQLGGGLDPDCGTRVRLTAGTLAVHARKLEGHPLRIDTPFGGVEVRGTVFGVEVAPDQLRVRVAEGVVEVDAGGAVIRIAAGSELHVARHAGDRAMLPASHAALAQLRQSLGLSTMAPPQVQPEPGTSVTEEGRPMSKPRIVAGEEKP
jgi:ferric-dicitrate binding protein FerR (iron transport regulator)